MTTPTTPAPSETRTTATGATGAPADATTAIERSSLLVNAVACTDHSRVLADGDRIDVLPPFAGG